MLYRPHRSKNIFPTSSLIWPIIFFLTSCFHFAEEPIQARIQRAEQISHCAGLKKSLIQTKDFLLTTYYRSSNNSALPEHINAKNIACWNEKKNDISSSAETAVIQQNQDSANVLNVYIEGDGFAWATAYRASDNPTPLNPVVLKMAALDNSESVLYIARPCQYTPVQENKNCADNRYWTHDRYAAEVASAINEVIDKFIQTRNSQYHSSTVNLFGFSGGGALAILVAAARQDVKYIATIAANLDHQAVSLYHGSKPINGSLNAIDFISQVKQIPQLHIAGAEDDVVPPEIIRNFTDKIRQENGHAQFILVPSAQHNDESHPNFWPIYWSQNRFYQP